MTLASPFAAIAAWFMMGETMSLLALLGMIVTLSGIGISIMGKDDAGARHLKLPRKGILLGIGAGMGQGIGLVLSKQGLMHYAAEIPAEATDVAAMMPFAGTQIRAIMGLIGFGATLLFLGKWRNMLRFFTDVRGAAAAMGAILLGPFFGVSLSLMAVGMTNTGVAQTLMSLTPILILWPSRMMFGTKVSMQEVVGAVIAVAGASLFFL
jgi:drug/metabolite transporter (DMT)-like permease